MILQFVLWCVAGTRAQQEDVRGVPIVLTGGGGKGAMILVLEVELT